MQKSIPQAGRPAAAADAPIGALVERGEDLARAWLAQLVRSWPLELIDQLPLNELAHEGPAVCVAALRALAGDEALERVASQATALGTTDGELAVWVVEGLRRALWGALLEEMTAARARAAQLAPLADRLGHVCATLTAAAVSSRRRKPAIVAPVEAPQPRRLRQARSALDGDPAVAEPWLAAIDRRIATRASDGRPFAVLLAELDGLDRLADADAGGDVSAALGRAERALLECLRPGDELLRERPGRYWVLAPDTEAADAHKLAWQFAAAPREVEGHRGAPLSVSIGIALCPDDGEASHAIAEQAETALFKARAAGMGVALR